MIWQLVKRDPLWRGTLICTAVGAVACPALPRGFIGLFGWLIGMYWLQSQPHRRATDFQAALPIRACDLFLARIVSFFALVWLPVASGSALLLLVRRPPEDVVPLIGIGAALSVLVLVAQSPRVREIAGSQWASSVSVAIVWIAAYAIWEGRFVPRAVARSEER